MDTIRIAVEPLSGFVRPIDQVRIWLNDEELAAVHDRFGPEPQALAAANERARKTGSASELPIALCSYCLDEGCGYTTAEILYGDGTVTWNVYDVWSDLEDHHELTGQYTFEIASYDAAMVTVRVSTEP
jgi:hypothetical protein